VLLYQDHTLDTVGAYLSGPHTGHCRCWFIRTTPLDTVGTDWLGPHTGHCRNWLTGNTHWTLKVSCPRNRWYCRNMSPPGITECCTMSKNRSRLGYIGRRGWTHWELSLASTKPNWWEHVQANGSICLEHVFIDLGLRVQACLNRNSPSRCLILLLL
jgi:hypothetical protein